VKYAATIRTGDLETVAITLPRAAVSRWDPDSPAPNTCLVPDGVEAGWVRDAGAPGGWAPPPPPTADQIRRALEASVQRRLDDFVRERGYDGIAAACTYAASGVPAYRSDALVCVDARDRTWRAFFEATEREPLPAPEEILAGLPELKWPPDGGPGGAAAST
jgi:hypothetical protein